MTNSVSGSNISNYFLRTYELALNFDSHLLQFYTLF